MYNIGKSVNSVVIPDLVESTILESIIKAQENDESELEAQKKTAIEFYFNDKLNSHFEA